jgi:hypothetical protein
MKINYFIPIFLMERWIPDHQVVNTNIRRELMETRGAMCAVVSVETGRSKTKEVTVASQTAPAGTH